MAMTAVHEKAIEAARNKNVEILFDKPLVKGTTETHVWIKCPDGIHEKEISWEKLGNYHWCGKCRTAYIFTIRDMQEVAALRGGKCLSTAYEGNKINLTWECSFGHTWIATPNNIKSCNSWCPHCNINIGEELSREVLKEAFPNKEFLRTRRPAWLNKLELDGYCEELSLAFEYHGKQHYERVEHFQRDDDSFEAQVERDRLTAQYCAENNVILITVPYYVGFLGIRSFIREEIKKYADRLPEPAPIAIADTNAFIEKIKMNRTNAITQLEKARRIAIEKGGECLSEHYTGYRIPLEFRCQFGHLFSATLEAIDQPIERGPRFCTECNPARPKEDDEVKLRVEACGYRYFSSELKKPTVTGRARKYIHLACPQGHEYEVSWENFCPKDNVPKRGCMECRNGKIGKLKRIDIAVWSRETGLVPNGEYKSITQKYDWTCKEGHKFNSSISCMRLHAYDLCKICDMIMFAETLNLTSESLDAEKPEWRCGTCSHVFAATKMSLACKKGIVCPNCRDQ